MIALQRCTLFLFVTGLLILPAQSQDHHQRYEAIDVLSYLFEIDLNDTSNVIRGNAHIEISFKEEVDQFYLDLSYNNEGGTGMKVTRLWEDGRETEFLQQDDRIILKIPRARQGSKRSYNISYRGIPADGLIIDENKFGERTFFGDNWPNRGHHWLPLVDHPSDKALVEFMVTAPDHYGIVSVGEKISENIEEGKISSRWRNVWSMFRIWRR